MSERVTRQLEVRDEHGNLHALNQITEFIDDRAGDEMEGLSRFELNGSAVNRIDDQTFRTLAGSTLKVVPSLDQWQPVLPTDVPR